MDNRLGGLDLSFLCLFSQERIWASYLFIYFFVSSYDQHGNEKLGITVFVFGEKLEILCFLGYSVVSCRCEPLEIQTLLIICEIMDLCRMHYYQRIGDSYEISGAKSHGSWTSGYDQWSWCWSEWNHWFFWVLELDGKENEGEFKFTYTISYHRVSNQI